MKDNALIVKYPELADEWSDKNDSISPADVSYGSNRVVWWKGKCGHEWKTSVKARTKGEGCPYCTGKRVLVGFNDLATICPDLIAEWSDKNVEADISSYTAGSQKKVWWNGNCGHEWKASIKNRVKGSGCPYCTSHKIKKGENDLESTRPDIAKEWSERNYPIKASDVMANTNKKFWWKCDKGHEWKAPVSSRNKGSKCPYCSGVILLPGFNDLASTNPELVSEWSDKNTVSPKSVNAKSRVSVIWTCKTCGYEWSTAIYKRVNGGGCPYCKRLETVQNNMNTEYINKYKEKFEINYPWLLMKYLLTDNEIKVVEDDMEEIGIKLQMYIPEYHSAIIIQEKRIMEGQSYRREVVRNRLCRAKGIKLFRILEPADECMEECICIKRNDYTSDSLDEAFNVIFKALGIDLTANSKDISGELFKKYVAGDIRL